VPLAWRINLDRPPRILHSAVAVHGHLPVEHWHDLTFWTIHAYRYRADLRIDDTWYRIGPGSLSVFRPGADLEYRFRGLSEHVYVHFELPSDPAARWEVAATHSPGRRGRMLDRSLREAAGWLATQPARSSARVWDVLWELARPASEPSDPAAHPAVMAAMEIVERRLATTIVVEDLARAVGVSHNHLTRLFRQQTGDTILAYVRRRRALRAEHLLTRTDLPVKVVAIQVGLKDLQQFNKTIRRELGRPPTALRRAVNEADR
jgi:AraC-like DNA-binding protein